VEHWTRHQNSRVLVSTLLRQGEREGLRGLVHARCWVLRDRMRFDREIGSSRTSGPFLVACLGDWGGYRPYFENYTVDASIFEPAFLVGSER